MQKAIAHHPGPVPPTRAEKNKSFNYKTLGSYPALWVGLCRWFHLPQTQQTRTKLPWQRELARQRTSATTGERSAA